LESTKIPPTPTLELHREKSRVVAVYGPSYFMTSLSHEENEC